MNKHVLILGTIGFATGCVSFLVKEYSFLPGTIFGIGVGLYFVFTARTPAAKVAVWVLVSTAAYHIAIRLLGAVNKIPLAEVRNALQGTEWSFFIAGAGGGLVMLLGFHSLLGTLRAPWQMGLTLLGGVLGVVAVTLFPIVQGATNSGPLLAIYTIWQTGMALGLGASRSPLK